MVVMKSNTQMKFGFNDINHIFAIYFRGQSSDKTCVFCVRSALESQRLKQSATTTPNGYPLYCQDLAAQLFVAAHSITSMECGLGTGQDYAAVLTW